MPVLIEERPTRIDRAVEVVAAQSDCTPEEATAMLRARAVIFDRPVEEVAEAVLERRMRFRY
jgi:AmiR/NasT family two-component response regulator